MPDYIITYFHILWSKTDFWTVLGFAAQALFMSRFIVQWIASERAKNSVIPVAFWFISIGGGLGLLAYGIARHDAVIIFGQALGLVVYMRNLRLIYKSKKRALRALQQ